MENECIGCGCSDTKACVNSVEPCNWLAVDETLGLGVCSSCPDHAERFKLHQQEMATAFKE